MLLASWRSIIFNRFIRPITVVGQDVRPVASHLAVVAIVASVRERGRQVGGAKEGEPVECSSTNGTGEAVVTGLTAANYIRQFSEVTATALWSSMDRCAGLGPGTP